MYELVRRTRKELGHTFTNAAVMAAKASIVAESSISNADDEDFLQGNRLGRRGMKIHLPALV